MWLVKEMDAILFDVHMIQLNNYISLKQLNIAPKCPILKSAFFLFASFICSCQKNSEDRSYRVKMLFEPLVTWTRCTQDRGQAFMTA